MPIEVHCSGFSGSLAHLNGIQTIKCGRLRLVLAALTCGYDGFFKTFDQNWHRRMAQIVGNVAPYIKHSKKYGFTLDNYYFMTDSSENKSGAYYIGQALTKIFADEILLAPAVLHASRCEWVRTKGIALKAPLVTTGRREADLFAFGRGGEKHVLEAKGRSVKDSSMHLSPSTFNAAMNQALGQVSAVASINGAVPTSRCGAVWTLCTSGIRGDVRDPPGIGFNVQINEHSILTESYRYVFDTHDASFSSGIVSGYDVLEVERGYYFGIKTKLRRYLLSGGNNLAEALTIAEGLPPGLAQSSDLAASSDGTIICAR